MNYREDSWTDSLYRHPPNCWGSDSCSKSSWENIEAQHMNYSHQIHHTKCLGKVLVDQEYRLTVLK